VRGRPAERLHLAEVEQRSALESHSALPVTVIGKDELDPGGQLARLHRHVNRVILIAWRIRSHTSMVLEEESKSRATRYSCSRSDRSEMQVDLVAGVNSPIFRQLLAGAGE